MSDELKDILSTEENNTDNRQLMDYVNNNLPNEQQHAIEKNMAADAFTNDAVEGLQQFENKKDIGLLVAQLNTDLHKKTAKKTKQRQKRTWKDQPYTYVTILVVLLLIIISYIIIKKYLGH